MTRTDSLPALAVALLVLAAGCAGVGGSGDGQATQTSPEAFDYPSGLDESGLSATVLLDHHQSALESAGSATVSTRKVVRSGDVRLVGTSESRFSGDTVLSTGVTAPSLGGVNLTTAKYSDGDGTVWKISPESKNETEYRVSDDPLTVPTAIQPTKLAWMLEAGNYTATAATVVNGTPVVRYTADTVDNRSALDSQIANGTVTSFSGAVLVTESGVVRNATVSFTWESPGGPQSRDYTYSVSG
ncbi:MAG: hypothetical protein ABEJ68_00500, partial [Halobacteriaceae archaeon]